jgi:hypothetical protein
MMEDAEALDGSGMNEDVILLWPIILFFFGFWKKGI